MEKIGSYNKNKEKDFISKTNGLPFITPEHKNLSSYSFSFDLDDSNSFYGRSKVRKYLLIFEINNLFIGLKIIIYRVRIIPELQRLATKQ